MHAPDSVEAVLARLMPPALSQQSQSEMEEMIDDLAATRESAGASWYFRCAIGGGLAAAIGALIAIYPTAPKPPTPQAVAESGYSLVSGSDRIESMTDEGWREDVDGSAMHSLRLSAIEESRIRDEESGMVVLISEPREEILLMPVTSF